MFKSYFSNTVHIWWKESIGMPLKPYLTKRLKGNWQSCDIENKTVILKSSNGNNFIVLLKIGLSCFINKLSLRNNLNLLQSVVKMLNSTKFMVQLHCNRWSDIADCLMFFEVLSSKTGDPYVFSRSGIKVTKGFSIISILAVIIYIMINYSRAKNL